MERRWWEHPVIILNDFWFLFLLGLGLLVGLILTRGIWMPALGFDPPAPVPPVEQIILTPGNELSSSTSQPEDPQRTLTPLPDLIWNEYRDPDWNFSIEVPNRTKAQMLTQVRSIEQLPDGLNRMLLFVDSPDSSEQDRHPSETLRIRVFRLPASDLSFDEWVVQSSTGYVNNLQFDDQNSCASYSGENKDGEDWILVKWVEDGDFYLGLIVQGKTDHSIGEKIIESFQTGGCQS